MSSQTRVVLGTAGHIDHGKTALVKALTGIDTDRLKEEKARGITIELGFAHLELPDGTMVGIVDVPGHERFVKNMVAGASGIDLVLMVVAADEGVMPQTVEHLHICRLLGVRAGLVALTKVDLVDEEWLELVKEDVAELVKGSFLEGAEVVPTSVVTGEGLEDLVQAIARVVKALPGARREGPLRLPVDRVFVMKGFGTVVTGTAVGGVLNLGEEVVVYPGGAKGRVRGIQVHGKPRQQAVGGQRTAMNIQGISRQEVKRGDVLAPPDTLEPSLWLDVELELLGSARELKHRAPVRVHVGTAEVMARVHLLTSEALAPGASALCQLRLEEPVAVMAGDHFVLRSYSPVTTIGGGRILHPHPGRRKRNRPEVMEELSTLATGSLADRLLIHARATGAGGLRMNQMIRLTGADEGQVTAAISELASQGGLVVMDPEEKWVVAASVLEELAQRMLKALEDYHRTHPLRLGMPKQQLVSSLGEELEPRVFTYLLETLTSSGRIVQSKAEVRLATHQVALKGEAGRLKSELEETFARAGRTPPTFREIAEGRDEALVREVVELMVSEGTLVKVKEGLYFHHQALSELKQLLVDYLTEHGEIGAAEYKELTGLTRKYLIPLLEYFDAARVTMRIGDKRVLRTAPQDR